jgi:hypothetical protein
MRCHGPNATGNNADVKLLTIVQSLPLGEPDRPAPNRRNPIKHIGSYAIAAAAIAVINSAPAHANPTPTAPFYDCAQKCYSYCSDVEGHFPSPYDRCMTACERQACPS